MTMWSGVFIGAISFLIIGIFHPIVIKCEYYFTERVWPAFLAGGILFCILSLFVNQIIISSALAITGFSMLWSIKELKEQTQRVKKGWFPENPKRKKRNQLSNIYISPKKDAVNGHGKESQKGSKKGSLVIPMVITGCEASFLQFRWFRPRNQPFLF